MIPMDDSVRLLDLAPVEWEQTADALSPVELRWHIDNLERVATQAARLATYLGERYGYGCGDQGHRRAVKRLNTVARQVRRALGYDVTPELRI